MSSTAANSGYAAINDLPVLWRTSSHRIAREFPSSQWTLNRPGLNPTAKLRGGAFV